MRLPPRRVRRLFLGGFLVKSLKTKSFVWFSSARRCFRFCCFHSVLSCFLATIFRNCRKIPCFTSFIFDDFWGFVANFCLESLKN